MIRNGCCSLLSGQLPWKIKIQIVEEEKQDEEDEEDEEDEFAEDKKWLLLLAVWTAAMEDQNTNSRRGKAGRRR